METTNPSYGSSFENDQFELQAGSVYRFEMNRRKFFKVLGSGIAIAFMIPEAAGFSTDETSLIPENQIGAWIHVNENGRVTVFTGKVEVGQNIRTSLAQIVAEELNISVDSIEMVMGDTDLTPYDRGTFGSRSIPYMGPQLRKAAASAREVFKELAAKTWKTNASVLKLENGKVIHTKTGQSLELGKLAEGKQLLNPIKEDVEVTPVQQWKMAGKSVPKVNGEAFVTGKHQYVSDLKLPGMLYGKIVRPVAYGATVDSVDVTAAKNMTGVTVVQDGNFLGVAAADVSTASEALSSIKIQWKTEKQSSRTDIFDYFRKNAKTARTNHVAGNVEKSLTSSFKKLQQTFTIDYIAHAPLEPRAALAEWKEDKLTVWTGTQRPFGVQEELAEVFSMSKDKIRVIMPDTGSGYGGKHTGEAAIEAARLAKAAGKPVKVVWTREEEFTWAYFRPGGVIDVSSGVSEDGTLSAWEFHNYNSGASGIESPYEISHQLIQFHPVDSPLRQGSYRGLASTANVFARESHMDDTARLLRMDPLEFRLRNLKDERLKAVLEASAKKFGWRGSTPQKDHGFGIACGFEKGSYVATCAEVSVNRSSGEVKVVRAVAAFECGAIINPNHLENQVQGSIVQGLGGALFESIDFKDGKILNSSFSRYRVPRFKDTPQLEIVMLDRKDLPSVGAGETPIIGIAPAIRNAIVNATGIKLYSLPLVPNGLVNYLK